MTTWEVVFIVTVLMNAGMVSFSDREIARLLDEKLNYTTPEKKKNSPVQAVIKQTMFPLVSLIMIFYLHYISPWLNKIL